MVKPTCISGCFKRITLLLIACVVIGCAADEEVPPPFGFLDNITPIAWQQENAIRGWALSKHSSVTVSIFAKGIKIISTQANSPRQDVATSYPSYSLASTAGFGVIVPFDKLPRGRYPLSIELMDALGNKSLLQGPMVINDTPIANIDSLDPIVINSKNILQGWFAGVSGKVRLGLKQVNNQEYILKAVYPRADVDTYFKSWSQNKLLFKGFDHLLNFRDFPRGRYKLQISLADDNGVFYQSKGPVVVNDLPIGRVISPHWNMFNPGRVSIKVWVADEDGIATVKLTTDSGHVIANMPVILKDVSYKSVREPREQLMGEPSVALHLGQVHSGLVNAKELSVGVHRLLVEVTDKDNKVNVLPGPLIVNTAPKPSQPCQGSALKVLMPADTQQFRNGFREMQELKQVVNAGCVQVGIRGRVEYLRTTTGAHKDFKFDPNFPDAIRKNGNNTMTTTALNELLDLAETWQVPLLITLDGGPWADASFSAPNFDVVDYLENDDANVQWNQFGKAEDDDALSKLPGSYDSPQLARMMTLNYFNERYRYYKKRNIQAAAKIINTSNAVKQGLYVGVNLDPDQYINPWFYKTQWYDYNPDTIRQFRQWLTSTGLYSSDGVLAGKGLEKPLTIDMINRLAKQNWKKLDQIEPDRAEPDYNSAWHQIWTQYKRHLVAEHYNDLANWLYESGMDSSRIYSSQTFIQTDIAITINSYANGWTDEAGVSMAGAKPDKGRLGAILYGPSSRNEGTVRNGQTLFANIRKFDSTWAVPELHPATIEFPDYLPSYSESYQTMASILNAGVTFISPMWGSHASDQLTYTNKFKSYDAFTGTDFEYQLVWWLLQRQRIPVGSLLYPFGNKHVYSTDGWAVTKDIKVKPLYGALELWSSQSTVTVLSPDLDQLFAGKQMTLKVKGEWPAQCKLGWVLGGDDALYQMFEAQLKPVVSILFAADHISSSLRLRWSDCASSTIILDEVSLIENY